MPLPCRSAVCLLLSFFAAAPLIAQDTAGAPLPRRVSLLAGFGNQVGWLGAQGEAYFASGRLSGFLGVGVTPNGIYEAQPHGITFAGGLRAYTAEARHRFFAEASVSQIAIDDFAEGDRHYGPGLQAGWQYTARGGFTLALSAGVGYALAVDDAVSGSRFKGIGGLSLGYTWRAKR